MDVVVWLALLHFGEAQPLRRRASLDHPNACYFEDAHLRVLILYGAVQRPRRPICLTMSELAVPTFEFNGEGEVACF